MNDTLYFAYGSNMNLSQMAYRCPNAKAVGIARVENYKLAFCGNSGGRGVATILQSQGNHVDGVLWQITADCEKSLNLYEGYPHLYGKEKIRVCSPGRPPQIVMVYTMNEPYRSCPAVPSRGYLNGILEGCRQNGISTRHIYTALQKMRELPDGQQSLFPRKTKPWEHER